MLWDDRGPVSQGKILTALLQDDETAARDMLRRWSVNDLDTLAAAAQRLQTLCGRELVGRQWWRALRRYGRCRASAAPGVDEHQDQAAAVVDVDELGPPGPGEPLGDVLDDLAAGTLADALTDGSRALAVTGAAILRRLGVPVPPGTADVSYNIDDDTVITVRWRGRG